MAASFKLPSVPLERLNEFVPKTALESLGIRFTAISEDSITATMPVDHRTRQPYGFLHGGASALLAETLGSVGAALLVDTTKVRCFGVEINANHISAVRDGYVTGVGRPIHIGKSTQVWDIQITGEDGKLVCVSRLTLAVTPIVVA
jgi:1,4-dihydroxy-2-naphthoyl-CoA hydrolase